jgi:hypothetical protein
MTVQVADAHAHVQRVVSVVNLATMLDGCTTETRRSVVRSMWENEFSAKDIIHKEMIPVYCGKCDFHLFDPLKTTLLANVSHVTKRLKRRHGNG